MGIVGGLARRPPTPPPDLPDHAGESPLLSRSGGEKGLRGSGAGTLGVPLGGPWCVGGLTPRGSLECNPEIPAFPGEENFMDRKNQYSENEYTTQSNL